VKIRLWWFGYVERKPSDFVVSECLEKLYARETIKKDLENWLDKYAWLV